MDCPFCCPTPERVFHGSDPGFICLWDGFAVSPGHALVVPRRHVATWFEATFDEQVALLRGIEIAKQAIESRHRPDGFNIGVNVGAAGGQTVPHLHVHVIPRYTGDVPDPRGGVRYVIPDKANYLVAREPPARYAGDPAAAIASVVSGTLAAPLLEALKRDLSHAVQVDIAVAFVLASGLAELEPSLIEVLQSGGRVRLLTGDYMDVTEPRALLRLLDLREELELTKAPDAPNPLDVRVFQTDHSIGFHPKAYLVGRRGGELIAYIGSSNLTHSALVRGSEWNARLSHSAEPRAIHALSKEFEELFAHPKTAALDQGWIDGYLKRRRPPQRGAVMLETNADDEPAQSPPTPHPIQQAALIALDATRKAGNRAGLVVLATGLGKTWLAAFDSAPFTRVLFVAHREEILRQAAATFRRIRPESRFGFYAADEKARDAEVLFASVQSLGRSNDLRHFAPDAFDYIVIDEFHHASAATYRRLIDHFSPAFMLALTATPDRSDGADLLALCGENLVFTCDLWDGVEQTLLSPFRYFGVPDVVDFSNIPWRSRSFDPAELEAALATAARAQNALEQWQVRKLTRTLGFCVSQRHADFMRDYFAARGVRCVAVHSGPGSASRVEALQALAKGELDVVFSVDMFNEGIDVPSVDTLLMLRPSESKILWLQQFGRGLRRSEGKEFVSVIDYIGNHRSFLQGAAALLLETGDRQGELRAKLEDIEAGRLELPEGCSVTYDLEAIAILRGLLPVTGRQQAIAQWVAAYVDLHGTRPTLSELWHAGFEPATLRGAFGGWFGYLRAQGLLSQRELAAFDANRELLEEQEVTRLTKSYKPLVLLAMIAKGRVPGSVELIELAAEVRRMAARSAALSREIEQHDDLESLLINQPIHAFTGGNTGEPSPYFRFENGRFHVTVGGGEGTKAALPEMLREICDLRLAQYLSRRGDGTGRARFFCKVFHSNGSPILKLPDRQDAGDLPVGDVPVLVDGKHYTARFVKIAINVLEDADTGRNELATVLRRWFGPAAGANGRADSVLFDRSSGEWVMQAVTGAGIGAELWKAYDRRDIPPLFGLEFSTARWNQGFVRFPDKIFLLVSLGKEGLNEEHRYADEFVSPTELNWVSQNKTRAESKDGIAIREHARQDITVHLFVRKTRKTQRGGGAPFLYCGPVHFVRSEGSEPMKVNWRLEHAVPEGLFS